MKRIILIACATLVYSNIALGNSTYGTEPFLAKFDFENDALFISLNDQARDGCMPSPQKVTEAFESELGLANFKIAEPGSRNPYFFSISVIALTVADTSKCVYWLNVKLDRSVVAKIPGTDDDLIFITPTIWDYSYVGVTSMTRIQGKLEESAKGVVENLVLEMSKVKE